MDLRLCGMNLKLGEYISNLLCELDYMIKHDHKDKHAQELISKYIFNEKIQFHKTPLLIPSKYNPLTFILNTEVPPILSMSTAAMLQVIQCIIKHFALPASEESQNKLFLALFGGKLTAQRLLLLCRLVHVALKVSQCSIISGLTAWIEYMGNRSTFSIALFENIIFEFVIEDARNIKYIVNLPRDNLKFSLYLLAAVDEIYYTESMSIFNRPPLKLLKVIMNWIQKYYIKYFVTQKEVMSEFPLAQLLRWTITSPLLHDEFDYKELYSALHEILLVNISNKYIFSAVDEKYFNEIIETLKSITFQLFSRKSFTLQNIIYGECVLRLLKILEYTVYFQDITEPNVQILSKIKELKTEAELDDAISNIESLSFYVSPINEDAQVNAKKGLGNSQKARHAASQAIMNGLTNVLAIKEAMTNFSLVSAHKEVSNNNYTAWWVNKYYCPNSFYFKWQNSQYFN